MIAYEIYKFIHIASIFAFLMGATVLLMSRTQGKFWKIWTGVASFFILFGGMGMQARLQVGWPAWIQAKIVLWLLITMLGHIVAKRFPQQGNKAFAGTFLIAVLAAWIALFKPF